MRISTQQWDEYRQNGYLLVESYFTTEETTLLRHELPPVFALDGPQRVLEQNGLVRSVYGVHSSNSLFARITRLPRLLEPAMEILGSKVYVYQSKVNAKLAMGGDIWEWHQDFIFWEKEDGLPKPRLVNMAIWLDDVNEFNGPLMFIPGSHRLGMVDASRSQFPVMSSVAESWDDDVSAHLKFTLDAAAIRAIAQKNGIVAPKGPRGSLLIFDPNIFHASSSNMSPEDRVVLLITYNSVHNLPVAGKTPRPEFLVSQDYRPLEPLSSDDLI